MGKNENQMSELVDREIPLCDMKFDPPFDVMANPDGGVLGQDISPEERKNARHFD